MSYTPLHLSFETLETRALLSAGSLDPSFGVGGKVITTLPNVIGLSDVAVLGDQSIVAAVKSGTLADSKMRLLHFSAGGVLDETFGTNGVASVDFGSDTLTVNRLLVQQDGKILAVGQKSASETSRFALARLMPSGALDPGFGAGGLLAIDVGNNGGVDYASDALQLDNGQILVAGSLNVSFTTVLRLNLNGTIDDTFGDNGAAVAAVDMTLPRIALAPDGKIVTAHTGHKDIKSGTNIARFTAGGILDAGFSGDGLVFYENFFGGDVVVTPTNRTVIVGYDASGNIVVRRLIPGGGGDTTLSPTGSVSYASGADNVSIADAEIQSDGKIIFVGQAGDNGEGSDFLVGRLNADLTLDTTFGTSGLTRTEFKGFDAASGVDVDAFGKLVVSGDTFTTPEAGDEAGALARYSNAEASAGVVNGSWIINGTSINDFIRVSRSDDNFTVVITGGDTFSASAPIASVSSIVVSGGSGNDGIQIDFGIGDFDCIINGNAGNDNIHSGDGDDLIIGANGNDRLDGGDGADTLIGGSGKDMVAYERLTGITAGIGDIPGGSGEPGEHDLISNSVERIRGTGFADHIVGSNAANTIFGGGGNDTIVGLGGDDMLFGEGENDRLIGGLGADVLNGDAGLDRADSDAADTRISIESLLT